MEILVRNYCYVNHVCGSNNECIIFGMIYRCLGKFLYAERNVIFLIRLW